MNIYDADGRFFGSINANGEIFDHRGQYRARTVFLPEENRAAILNINDRQVGQVKVYTLKNGGRCTLTNPSDIRLDTDGTIWKRLGEHESTATLQQIGWMEPAPDDLYMCGGGVYLLTRNVFLFPDDGYQSPPPSWYNLDPRYFHP